MPTPSMAVSWVLLLASLYFVPAEAYPILDACLTAKTAGQNSLVLVPASFSQNWTGPRSGLVVCFVLHVLGLVMGLASNGSIAGVIARTRQLYTPSALLTLALTMSNFLLSLVWNIAAMAQEAEPCAGGSIGSGDVVAININISGSGSDGDAAAIADGNFSIATGCGHGDDPGSLTALRHNRTACYAVGFLWQTLLAASTLYQAAMACDRYFFIVHPLRYESLVTKRKVGVVAAILGLLAIALPVVTLLSGGSYVYLVPAATCVNHLTWYVLFIALIFLPSFSVTLASNVGIWSLCVRQLNTPGRTKLFSELTPNTHAFNLESNKGRVAVRRDIVDEFTCCLPSRRRNSAGVGGDTSPCLSHLVQNSSLFFIEGCIAAVPRSAAAVGIPQAESVKDDFPQPDSDLPSAAEADRAGGTGLLAAAAAATPADRERNASASSSTGEELLAPPLIHAVVTSVSSDPSSSSLTPGPSHFCHDFLTPTPARRKPAASPSNLSCRGSRRTQFQRAASFHVSHILLPEGSSSRNRLSDCQDDEGKLTIEMKDFSLHHVCGSNLQVMGLSPAPSPSKLSDSQPLFFCNTSLGSAMSIAASRTSQRNSVDDGYLVLSTVVNPIMGWILRTRDSETAQRGESCAANNSLSNGSLGPGLTLGGNILGGGHDSDKDGGNDRNGAVGKSSSVQLRRRAKAALLVALPVICLVITVLPLVLVQVLWVAGLAPTSTATAWVCHVAYVLTPSLSSIFMGLSNRHLRRAFPAAPCCSRQSHRNFRLWR